MQRVIAISLSSVLSLTMLPSRALAAPTSLPPRPTPTSINTSSPGGLIELRVGSMHRELWAVVEWQDTSGDWHRVDGWQGTLDDGRQVWWVAPDDLGKGPFRWAVYDRPGGNVRATSDEFYLPAVDRGIVQVNVRG